MLAVAPTIFMLAPVAPSIFMLDKNLTEIYCSYQNLSIDPKKFATPTLTTDLSEAIKDRELGLQI